MNDGLKRHSQLDLRHSPLGIRHSPLCLWLLLLLSVGPVSAEPTGRHFIYAQYDFILTFELVGGQEAILNVVNLTDGTYFLRSPLFTLTDSEGGQVKVDKIVVETGNPSDPYLTSNMKILPNSFIGLVLKGAFGSVQKFKSVAVQMGNQRCILDSLSALQFDGTAEKINKMNFDSPDPREDFRVLRLDFFGRKEAVTADSGR